MMQPLPTDPDPPWIKLGSISKIQKCGSFVQISELELLLVTPTYIDDNPFGDGKMIQDGIFIYDILGENWKLFMEYPRQWKLYSPYAYFDGQNDRTNTIKSAGNKQTPWDNAIL